MVTPRSEMRTFGWDGHETHFQHHERSEHGLFAECLTVTKEQPFELMIRDVREKSSHIELMAHAFRAVLTRSN